MMKPNELQQFEQTKPMLIGLAYRILGSFADAEDAVADTFLKWVKADRADINNPTGWLKTVCTRRCLDILQSAHKTKVDYVGEWLPEPVHTQMDSYDHHQAELSVSLRTAFLLVLDRLTPKERAAYLLHEIFEESYSDVATALEVSEASCRQLVSRARKHLENDKVRHVTPAQTQEQLLAAFQQAVSSGVTQDLSHLLSADVRFIADHGGKAESVNEVLSGIRAISNFIRQGLHHYWANYQWTLFELNGSRGFILKDGNSVEATVCFNFNSNNQVSEIFVTRNPDKLKHIEAKIVH